MMLGRVFLFLLLGFLFEGWVLVRVASATSFGFVFVLCILTFFVGLSLLRGASLRLQQDTQRAMASQGSVPRALAGAFAQLLAGLLLIMPGVIGDLIGALLMLPPLHGFALRRIRASKFAQSGQFQGMHFGGNFMGGGPQSPPHGSGANPPRGDEQSTTRTSFRDPDAPPPQDDYVPPRASTPDSAIIDAEIVDD